MNLLEKEVLLVDKPAGMSSFGVVARVRRVYTEQVRAEAAMRGLAAPKRTKVGHAGTLDPFATGLLVLLLGPAGTRRAQEFLKLDKRYEAVIKLGEVSSTGDIEGTKAPFYPGQLLAPSLHEVEEVLARFTGEIEQRVPAYSAVKINGRRAYDLARKGIAVEMPVRKVTVYELAVVSYEWPYLKIDCKVSSGTYIRALGEDIGAALGVGGYLTELRRTEVGKFKIAEAVGLEEVGEF